MDLEAAVEREGSVEEAHQADEAADSVSRRLICNENSSLYNLNFSGGRGGSRGGDRGKRW